MIRTVVSRGLLYSLGIAINRMVPERLFRFRIFRVFELHPGDDDEQANGQSAPSFHYRWCESDEDFHQAQQLTYFRTAGGLDRDRFSACLAFDDSNATRSSLPVGGVWRAVGWFDEEELGLRLALADDQAWIFAAYVSKQQRGRGTYRQLLSHVMRSGAALRHLAAINPMNRQSIAAHRSFMRSTVGTCVALRLLSLTIAWASGGLRLQRHITWHSHNAPLRVRIET